MIRKYHVRCGSGEKKETVSNSYLSIYPYCTPEIHAAIEGKVATMHTEIQNSLQKQFNNTEKSLNSSNLAVGTY